MTCLVIALDRIDYPHGCSPLAGFWVACFASMVILEGVCQAHKIERLGGNHIKKSKGLYFVLFFGGY